MVRASLCGGKRQVRHATNASEAKNKVQPSLVKPPRSVNQSLDLGKAFVAASRLLVSGDLGRDVFLFLFLRDTHGSGETLQNAIQYGPGKHRDSAQIEPQEQNNNRAE